jgi:hypothetical protein
MQGTRTRTRSHATPPLKRRKSVAPAGCSAFQQLLCVQPASGRLASAGRSSFRAGGQHGRLSALEARSS